MTSWGVGKDEPVLREGSQSRAAPGAAGMAADSVEALQTWLCDLGQVH